MKIHNQEILLYFNPSTSIGKKTRAYAQSVSKYINEMEYHKTNFTSTLWKQILSMLSMEPKQLMDKSNPYYQQHIKGRLFDEEGWINILQKNPDLIKAPIVIMGSNAVFCSNPTDVYRVLQKK